MTQERFYWLQGSCPRSVYDLLSYQLFESGAQSIQELDSSNTDTVDFKICDSESVNITKYCELLGEHYISRGDDENIDWDMSWRDQQKPVQVTDTLCVYPPWVEVEQRTGGINILLEAKQAFGTGTHESTSLIIKLMEVALRDKNLGGENPVLLDIGTGTGILAMYAEKLCGAQTVVTEIDPVTIPCIVENYELNQCQKPQGVLGFLNAFKLQPTFNVILCNMIRSELWPMRTEMYELLKIEGVLLISGQLASEKHYILDWMKESNMTAVAELTDGEWWAVAAQKDVK